MKMVNEALLRLMVGVQEARTRLAEERGQTLAEYGLILAVVAFLMRDTLLGGGPAQTLPEGEVPVAEAPKETVDIVVLTQPVARGDAISDDMLEMIPFFLLEGIQGMAAHDKTDLFHIQIQAGVGQDRLHRKKDIIPQVLHFCPLVGVKDILHDESGHFDIRTYHVDEACVMQAMDIQPRNFVWIKLKGIFI